MDIDLTKSLERLEARRQTIETEADLTGACQSIVELDNRIGKLLSEAKSLRAEIETERSFVNEICDKLARDYSALSQTCETFDLLVQLLELNKICQHIDSLKLWSPSKSVPETVASHHIDGLNSMIVSDIISKFDRVYKPLEKQLSSRQDLPYHIYAKRVADLRTDLDNCKLVVSEVKSDGA